ncbi:hypothetical protein SDC9_27595 [bioreactor metagenome]|uniref:Uncharacterized protein n=1 Tax=bioreactor metagenome TaxID=1076179 RepID=A0A644URM5_9ZZZZ
MLLIFKYLQFYNEYLTYSYFVCDVFEGNQNVTSAPLIALCLHRFRLRNL